MQVDASFWDKIAPKYSRDPIRDMEAYEYTLGRTRSYLTQADDVLELGCGTGSTALELAPFVKHITASDFSEGMLSIGRQKARSQNVSNIEFAKIDVADQTSGQIYDAILGHNLFHLVRNIDAAFAGIHKRLKPGGIFISKTPCLAEPGLGFKFGIMKLAIPLMQMVGKAPFVKMLSIRELETAITDAGFDIIETGDFPATPPARYIVARRI